MQQLHKQFLHMMEKPPHLKKIIVIKKTQELYQNTVQKMMQYSSTTFEIISTKALYFFFKKTAENSPHYSP